MCGALAELASEIERDEVRACARVEPVAQSVSQQIEGEDGGHDRERGKYDHVRRAKEIAAGVAEHCSPAWRGSEHSEAKKTERGFSEDCARHADGGLDEHGLNGIRQN